MTSTTIDGSREAPTQWRSPNAAVAPLRYVRIPRLLLLDGSEVPQVIGIYALIGRMWLIHHAAIPVSAADLQAYDPSLSYGAARYGLEWLVAHGWLHVTRIRGQKSAYTPTWGRIRGQSLAWKPDDRCLGRPRHIASYKLDLRILDLFLGSCTPFGGQRTAIIERYVDTPVLNLADVGSYARLLSGRGQATDTLRAWGLADEHHNPAPLAPTPVVLAIISQATLTRVDAPVLTRAGWRQLGVQSAPQMANTTSTLFFVPPDHAATVVPTLIASVIDARQTPDLASAARECTKTPRSTPHQSITSNLKQTHMKQIPPAQSVAQVREEHSLMNLVEANPSANRMHQYGLFPDTIMRYADVPLPVLEHVIAVAEATPGIRSKAHWVAWAISQWVGHGFLVALPATNDTVDWAALAQRYTNSAVSADASAAHDGTDTEVQPAPTILRSSNTLLADDHDACAEPPPDAVSLPAGDVTHHVHQLLEDVVWGTERHQVMRLTTTMRFERRGDVLAVWTSSATRAQVSDVLEAPLRRALEHTLAPPRIIRAMVHGVPPAHDTLPCPPELPPTVWAELSTVQRAVLRGARIMCSTIFFASPALERAAEHCLSPAWRARLCAAGAVTSTE